jgi:cardiolipin synthase
VFEEDWAFARGKPVNSVPPTTAPERHCHGKAICRVITDGPNEDIGKLMMTLSGAFALARQRIAIMTPYFLPPPVLINALQSAALRGVEVGIILPAQSNQKLAHWATRNMLWELLQYGVQIYYQPPPFAHSKFLLIDQQYAQIGSANMDPRSLRLNFELIVEVFDASFVATLAEHFEATRELSTQESLSGVDQRPFLIRIRDALAWLLSPYL